MFWREEADSTGEYRVPDDVFDLVFKLRGDNLDIDHAWALAQALQTRLGAVTSAAIGVHGIHMAGSGNGWIRPQQADATLPLSRRARLVIRIRRDDHAELGRLSQQSLQIGAQRVDIGDSSIRPLSTIGSLHARAISCDPQQSEESFLGMIADQLNAMDIDVAKMICGKTGRIRAAESSIFTRALLVADLKPEESVRLQRRGIGDDQLIGCGLFVPHKGIEAVHSPQEQ